MCLKEYKNASELPDSESSRQVTTTGYLRRRNRACYRHFSTKKLEAKSLYITIFRPNGTHLDYPYDADEGTVTNIEINSGVLSFYHHADKQVRKIQTSLPFFIEEELH